jgi:hypothetical protein
MSWTKDSQARRDRPQDKELAGTLTEPEQVELAALVAQVDAEEAQILAPAMNRLRAEVAAILGALARFSGGPLPTA